MFIPPAFLDELRARLRTSEVVGKKVALKSKGKEFSGLCPFHKENTPSFTVNDEKGFYHCFGCGAHGDILKFVMEQDNLPFVDAVKELASLANLEMPKVDPAQIEQYNQAKSYYEVMEIACDFFQSNLSNNKIAFEYIQSRNITNEALAKFKIGYALDSMDSLRNYLADKNITDQQMLDVGLLAKNDSGKIYDKFRNRIMFPIIDIRGNVIAFGGRVLGDYKPKYLNSPETVIFKKGDILYNENNARKIAFKTGKIVVVEGYMDVIAMDMAGIKTAMAPLGTAITQSQIRRLWNMADEPVICMDGDEAGIRAMNKVANLCLQYLTPGKTLKFSSIPAGQDPDDFIKKHGVLKLKDILRNAKNLSETIWQNEVLNKNIDTPERKAKMEQRFKEISDSIADQSVARYYSNYFSQNMWEYFNKYKSKKSLLTNNLNIDIVADEYETLEGCKKVLLKLVWLHPNLLENDEYRDEFIYIEFESEKYRQIHQELLDLFDNNVIKSNKDLNILLEKSANHNYISELDNICQHIQPDLTNYDSSVKDFQMFSSKITLLNLRNELESIKIKQNFDINSDSVQALMQEVQMVETKISDLQNDD